MSESERIGAGSSRVERLISRKEAAVACSVHEKTIEVWGRAGAFVKQEQRGSRGKVRIGADAQGVPLFNPGWSRSGRADLGAADCQFEERKIDPELVRVGVREVAALLAELPPIPDVAKEALARGEPVPVVVARVEERGRIIQALIVVVGLVFIAFAALGAFAMATGRRLRF